MLAKDLLSDTVPSLKTSDTGTTALNWMEIFRISHLPIVNNKELLGVISDADIYDLNASDEAIGNHKLSLFNPYVYYNQHIYEVLELVSKLKLTIVPVLNNKQEYMGLITMQNLIQNFATLSALGNPGGIIVLELNDNDYYLSQIAQIIESNDAKILSLYISSSVDSTKLDLTLKINKTDLSGIIQTFERYNYQIKASFLKDDELDQLYKERFDSFIKYLNI
ncbi:MAG: CBS domain-containing protein [Bacteroidales bacterium]|nr:CBS domain-containing protein [Bacteroidales bacterium]